MKIYFDTLGLDTELLEYFEWDETVKTKCVNFIGKLLQDEKMDSIAKLKSTLNLTYGEEVSLIVERYIVTIGVKMKPFEQLLRNNKITIEEYLRINKITNYEEHLDDARRRSLEPLNVDSFNKALDILNPKTKLEKESVPESKKKKNTRRGRKRKGEK
jgi:hypothetical protein